MTEQSRNHIQTRYLTTFEAGQFLDIPPTTVRQWLVRGKLDFVVKGATALVDRKDLEKIIGDKTVTELVQL